MTLQTQSALPSQFGTPEAAPREHWLAAARRAVAAGSARKLLPLLLVLALLLGLGVWVLVAQSAQAARAEQAEAAQRALARLAELQASVAAAEAGQRGHAITGEPSWLAPLQQAAARNAALLDELRTLSSADAAQYTRLVALAPLLAQRQEHLTSAADLRQRGGPTGTAAALAVLDNRRIPDQLQRALAELQTAAEGHLASARAAAADAARTSSTLTLVATLLSLGLTAAALLHGQHTAARLQRLRNDKRAQKEGQQRLQQAHAQLLESSLAPICFLDREGRIRRANPAAEQLCGGPGAALLGSPLAAHVLPDDQRKTERALDAAATAPQTLQHRWRRADGSLLHLRWSLQTVHEDGTLVAVAQDDTEARTLTQTLAQQEAALQQGSAALADAAARAGTAQARLGGFLATLSRCLRQPMSALLQQAANGQQGLHGAQDAAVGKAWSQALERARSLQEAVDHVLLLGRMEAGELELQREAFDVWDTLHKTVGLVQPTAERKGLRVRLALADDLGYAHGDTRRVEQALLNLLQEAVAAAPEGELHVAARRGAEGLIHFEVAHARADTAANLDELLSPLHDADKPASAEQLLRLLGVAMARALLQRMGGTLAVALRPPQGTVYEATLPADQLPQR